MIWRQAINCYDNDNSFILQLICLQFPSNFLFVDGADGRVIQFPEIF